MARNEQLIRQHKILQILERYKFGRLLNQIRDELVDELGLTSLHSRTVRRDLEALQAAGIDVDVHEEQRGKVWNLGSGNRGSYKVTASATELIALSLSRDLLHPLAGTPFWQGIESFWSKLSDELPDSVWDHYENYRQFLHVIGTPAKSYDKQHGILSTVNRAIQQHRIVEINYQSAGKPIAQRRIEPYAIVFHQSSLYIVAAANEVSDAEADRIRHFKLDRFRTATALDEWFKPLADFELEKHLAQSVGIFASRASQNFQIKIGPRAATWVIEDPWHPDQHVDLQNDGSILLTVQAAHELEIIPRVLALGGEAEILAPQSCREMIATMIQQMASKYNDDH